MSIAYIYRDTLLENVTQHLAHKFSQVVYSDFAYESTLVQLQST